MHPNDTLAALDWAVIQAEASSDALIRLTVLPALRELRDQAVREARQ